MLCPYFASYTYANFTCACAYITFFQRISSLWFAGQQQFSLSIQDPCTDLRCVPWCYHNLIEHACAPIRGTPEFANCSCKLLIDWPVEGHNATKGTLWIPLDSSLVCKREVLVTARKTGNRSCQLTMRTVLLDDNSTWESHSWCYELHILLHSTAGVISGCLLWEGIHFMKTVHHLAAQKWC